MVWSIDRLGRSVLHVANALAELDAAGVALYSDQQAIDSTTPMGRAMIQMASVFGEQERQIIRSRVLAGLDRVRQQGKKLGRPKVSPKIEDAIRRHLSAGNGILKVAALVGVGSGTVQRVKREMAEQSGRDGLIYTPARPSGATGRCQQDTVSLNCPGPPPLAKVGSAPNSRLSATTYERERMAGNVFRASAISAPVAICNTLMTRPRFGCP